MRRGLTPSRITRDFATEERDVGAMFAAAALMIWRTRTTGVPTTEHSCIHEGCSDLVPICVFVPISVDLRAVILCIEFRGLLRRTIYSTITEYNVPLPLQQRLDLLIPNRESRLVWLWC